MNVTEIRVKLLHDQPDKLRGFATVTIDHSLVIRDLKIIEGPNGIFVAMPSRKLCDRCQSCGGKNHLRARHCNDCGAKLRDARADLDDRGRPRLYADIAHPIHQPARDFLQGAVVDAYRTELERSKQADYVAQSFDDLDYDIYEMGSHGSGRSGAIAGPQPGASAGLPAGGAGSTGAGGGSDSAGAGVNPGAAARRRPHAPPHAP